MELSARILSDLVIYSKYARYLEDKKRRETWEEIIDRNMQMHIKKFPKLEQEIRENYKYVMDKKVLPSMRSLQFSGKPIELNPARIFNCCAIAINKPEVFSEVMFLLLSGCGVGVSIQKHHIEELPFVRHPLKKKRRFVIDDSITGWAESIKVLLSAYFYNKSDPDFDYSDIRPKGSKLITSGGKAPGPQSLKDCIHNIRKVLDNVEQGTKLTSLQVFDIICFIADSVLSGGIRRSSITSLFSFDDEEMIMAKIGRWNELNPQRARSNNSAVLLRHRIKEEQFKKYWERIEKGKTGEPAIFFSNDSEMLANPCHETSLKASGGMCNLVEINFSSISNQEDLNNCSKVASFIGTLQASYTNFYYLRDNWKRNVEKEALLGVSMTGIANNNIYNLNLKEAVKIILKENERVSKLIGINKAKRTTLVKPSGTASSVLGTSSGIHPFHSPYYIRRIRLDKTESLYKYLIKKIPNLIEDDFEKPRIGAVLTIPIKSPENSIFRDESSIDLLERVKYIYNNWILPGHREGSNTYNVSCTVSIKDNEWEDVGKWLWENKENYNGIATLPYWNEKYVQMPFEECTKEKYEELLKYLFEIDLSEIKEEEDVTDLQGEQACSGGACDVRKL